MRENPGYTGYDNGFYYNNINDQTQNYNNTQYPRSRIGLYETTSSRLRPRMTRNDAPVDVEVPGIKFGKHEGNLNLNYIRNLDLNGIIRTNNMEPLEKIAQNLIYSEIKAEDYEDGNAPKLLQTFQNAIEYLFAKQSKLESTNKNLDIKYHELINYSYTLEEELEKNKKQIARNAANKKEKEYLLMTYKSIVDFNCNPIENENIIINNINSTSIGTFQRNGIASNGKFYCHICSGKPFSTESALESHMKRRHLAQTKLDYEREREDKREEESYIMYEKKIEDMKNYFQTMINAQNEENARNKYNDDLNQIKRENEEKFRYMENYTKTILEELKNMVQTNMLQQEQNNKNIIEMTKISSQKEVIKEPQKIFVESPSSKEINDLTKSIEQINDMIKKQNDKRIENMQNEIKQLKEQNLIYQNKPQEKIIYKEIIKEIPINIPNNNNDNKNDNKNDNQIQPEKKDISKNESIIINDNPSPSNSINKMPPIEQNKKEENINKSDNINQSQSQNNIIISEVQPQPEEKIEISRDKKPISEDINKNNINNNEINNLNIINNNSIEVHTDTKTDITKIKFNKTDPSAFKKRNFKLLEAKKSLNKSAEFDELVEFSVNFLNRDHDIMDREKPSPNLYLKKIIPENRRQDDEKIDEDTSKVIDNKIKNYDFENKNVSDLLKVIEETLQNINEINSNNDFSNLYYETVQKAIDLKLVEEDEKQIKDAYDNGQLKRSRSSSKAKVVINQTNDELNKI